MNINAQEARAGYSLEIQRIYVIPAQLSKGIGALAIDFIKNYSKGKGFKFIWLGVWNQIQRAIQFYNRCGFVQVGSHEFMLGNDRQTDLIMECKIS